MLAKKTSKNQITLPKDIAKVFPGTDYFDIRVKDNKILMEPVKITPINATLDGVRKKMEKLGITEKDVDDAVKWSRRKRKTR